MNQQTLQNPTTDSRTASSEPVVEVFHWSVDRNSRDPEDAQMARARLAQFMMGDQQAVTDVLEAPEVWRDRGLTLSKVAEVPGRDLDLAYMLTNTIDTSWPESPEVECMVDGGQCRSTSVGDIMRRGEEVSVVANFGFAALRRSAAGQLDVAVEAGRPAPKARAPR